MKVECRLPELGENIEDGDVVAVLVREGDPIRANDGVVELETDKAVVEIPCPYGGTVTKIHVAEGDSVAVGQVLLEVDADSAADVQTEEKTPEEQVPAADVDRSASVAAPSATVASPIPAGPATRRLARQLGVDLGQVHGTGQRGRITPEDVEAAASTSSAEKAAAPPPAAAAPGEPGEDRWGPVSRERMSKIRRTIAAQMVKSATTIPHVTNFDDADVTELERFRKGIPPDYLGEGLKLTAMPFVMKAVALSLRRHPLLNASLDEDNEKVLYKHYVNLGVAVDTPRGLVVPAIRGVDRMTIPQIARELKTLAGRARAAEFSVEDLRGGTFTISNLGAVGGTYSTPLINHPEAAILLLGRSRWMPMVCEGNVEIRLMMPLSLSFDHRLIDGAAAGRFLNDVIGFLQSPGKLVLPEC